MFAETSTAARAELDRFGITDLVGTDAFFDSVSRRGRRLQRRPRHTAGGLAVRPTAHLSQAG